MAELFVIDPKPTFAWPVEITKAGGEKAVLELVFRHKTRAEFKAWNEGRAGRESVDILDEVIEGWSNVAMPYSREALAKLLDAHMGADLAILFGYIEGLAGAKKGN